jgi:hypothetical protein
VSASPNSASIRENTKALTASSSREFDTILFATGFRVTLPFLDGAALRLADGVPLRVAGMTVPVGLERLFFVGLAAPRGPQLPVYSAQTRLVAKLLTAQERDGGFAASALYARSSRPEARIDVPRHEWQRDMERAHRRIDRVLRRSRAVAAHRPLPEPVTS